LRQPELRLTQLKLKGERQKQIVNEINEKHKEMEVEINKLKDLIEEMRRMIKEIQTETRDRQRGKPGRVDTGH
jgi:uncharacterized coiled-coil protein SlyX